MSNIMYNLVPATMPNMRASGKFIAQVQVRGSLGFAEMADRMIDQGSSITKPDILAVFENLATALETAMLQGYRVNFGGLFDMFPSVSGTFEGITAAFNPTANSVDVRARCGSRIRNSVMAKASVERVHLHKPAPMPLEFSDLATGEANGQLTPGHIGTLSGMRLKFNGEAADEGVFLIPVVAGDAVRVTSFQRNQPKELVFLIPPLAAGTSYRLEVRARMNGSEDLRSGVLNTALAVAGANP